MIEDNISASDEEHEINNVPNYDLFNKDVFDIFFNKQKQLNWHIQLLVLNGLFQNINIHILMSIYMEEKWFKDTYLNKTIEDINDVNISYECKKEGI